MSSHHSVPGHSGLFGRGVGIDDIIIDFSKTFDLVPQDRLLTKLAPSDVDTGVVVWVREFFVGSAQKVRVGGQLFREAK